MDTVIIHLDIEIDSSKVLSDKVINDIVIAAKRIISDSIGVNAKV